MAKKTLRADIPDELFYALKRKCKDMSITLTDMITMTSLDWLDGPNELVMRNWKEIVDRFNKQNE